MIGAVLGFSYVFGAIVFFGVMLPIAPVSIILGLLSLIELGNSNFFSSNFNYPQLLALPFIGYLIGYIWKHVSFPLIKDTALLYVGMMWKKK